MRKFFDTYGYALPLVAIAMVAVVLIIHYYLVFEEADKITAYGDGISKLNNGRRIWDNSLGKVSLAQAGSIWLVGKSLLISLTAWWDPMYHSALSGSLWSMLFFVLTIPIVYEIVRSLTYRWGAIPSNLGGIAAAIVVALNTNFLYFGVSPMTESEVICAEAACCLALIKLEQDSSSWKKLWMAAVVLGLSGWVRYELWFFALLAFPIMALSMWAKGIRGYEFVAKTAMPFVLLGGTVITWVVFWQWQLYGDPLYFANSQYSARAIDVIGANKTFAVGDLTESARQYFAAVRLNIPVEFLVAGGIGLALYLIQQVGRRNGSTSLLYLVGIPMFFIVSLYLGQNAMDIKPEAMGSLNIRYGTTVLPLVGVGIGYLIANLARFRSPLFDWSGKILAVAGVASICYLYSPSLEKPLETAVLQDVVTQQGIALQEMADFFKTEYDANLILAESFGTMNGMQFKSGIPLKMYITENDPEAFKKALEDPVSNVDWILVRNGDSLSPQLNEPKFRDYYKVVFENDFGKVLVTYDRIGLVADR